MDRRLQHQMPRPRRRGALAIALSVGLFASCNSVADECIATLYPSVRSPYDEVFARIIEGIREGAGISLREYGLDASPDISDATAWLEEQRCEAAVVLGRRGLTTARKIGAGMTVVTGAVLTDPGGTNNHFPGISLVPDPAMVFGQLRKLAPEVKRVLVVYNPDNSASLIRLAQQAGEVHGLELEAVQATDIKSAIRQYDQWFGRARREGSAIWLLQDSTVVDSKVVLPLLLKRAWKHHVVLFANNPAFVNRGVLFALYPDHRALGRRLGKMVRRQTRDGGTVPLRDLLIAVNLRTAAHLDLGISEQQRRSFDLVFPAD